MSNFLISIGTICSLTGILLLTPLNDYLPADIWMFVKQSLSGSFEDQAYKIVPAPRRTSWSPAIWMTFGAALVWIGLFVRGE